MMTDTASISSTVQTMLTKQYKYVRAFTERLCEPLLIEDYVVQPVIDVSPPKWHLAHSTWFFENFILKPHLSGYQEYNVYFGYLFNSYYESAGKRWQRANRGQLTRPSVQEVYAYRAYVDEHMQKMLSQETLSEEVLTFAEIGLHHEQQHQELLFTDIKYILGNNPLFPVYRAGAKPPLHSPQKQAFDWIKVSEGIYQTGHQSEGFCYDNETPVHKVFLADFEIRRQAVTNAEWLEFMAAGGYQNHELWLSEGRARVLENNIEAPLYWLKEHDIWQQYTLGEGLTDIALDAPVTHISYYEADAFAAWKGMRLPTEHEWEAACQQEHDTIPARAVFAHHDYLQPQASGNDSLYGNVWQWTASAYLSYPNYKKAPGALGEYNGKFMSGQMVLRGGSCATDLSHIRGSYRNFFHADKRWQFTGLRLARAVV